MNIRPSLSYLSLLADCVETLLNTREFGGEEKEALREFEQEHGSIGDNGRKIVLDTVNRKWRESQSAAGVRAPLSSEERAKAFNDIESGN